MLPESGPCSSSRLGTSKTDLLLRVLVVLPRQPTLLDSGYAAAYGADGMREVATETGTTIIRHDGWEE